MSLCNTSLSSSDVATVRTIESTSVAENEIWNGKNIEQF